MTTAAARVSLSDGARDPDEGASHKAGRNGAPGDEHANRAGAIVQVERQPVHELVWRSEDEPFGADAHALVVLADLAGRASEGGRHVVRREGRDLRLRKPENALTEPRADGSRGANDEAGRIGKRRRRVEV